MNQHPARFTFDGNTVEEFEVAMRLVFLDRESAAGWSISDEHGFTLYWAVSAGYKDAVSPIPRAWSEYPRLGRFWVSEQSPTQMDVDECIDIVWRWLKEDAVYGEEPDIDGHCTRGFTLERTSSGFAGGSHYGFLSIKPLWAEHHK